MSQIAPDLPPETISLSESDREVLHAFGRIKHQKRRPTAERVFGTLKCKNLPEFPNAATVQTILDRMVDRGLLIIVHNPKSGYTSYREANETAYSLTRVPNSRGAASDEDRGRSNRIVFKL